MADLLVELTELDTIVTNIMTGMLPGDAGFATVQDLSAKLSDAISDAQRAAANAATPLFIHGNTKLVQVNKKLKEDIRSLNDLLANIQAITGVIDAATEFIGIFEPG